MNVGLHFAPKCAEADNVIKILNDRNARLRSRRTLRPATATYRTRLARSFRRRTSRLLATRLAAGVALLLGFALRLCSPLACRASGWLTTFL